MPTTTTTTTIPAVKQLPKGEILTIMEIRRTRGGKREDKHRYEDIDKEIFF